jgi:hypothetical protein
MIMDVFLFLARYAPFWGVPATIILAELCYMMWIRDKKKVSVVLLFLGVISSLSVAMYYYLGGPDKYVKAIIELFRYYSD